MRRGAGGRARPRGGDTRGRGPPPGRAVPPKVRCFLRHAHHHAQFCKGSANLPSLLAWHRVEKMRTDPTIHTHTLTPCPSRRAPLARLSHGSRCLPSRRALAAPSALTPRALARALAPRCPPSHCAARPRPSCRAARGPASRLSALAVRPLAAPSRRAARDALVPRGERVRTRREGALAACAPCSRRAALTPRARPLAACAPSRRAARPLAVPRAAWAPLRPRTWLRVAAAAVCRAAEPRAVEPRAIEPRAVVPPASPAADVCTHGQ